MTDLTKTAEPTDDAPDRPTENAPSSTMADVAPAAARSLPSAPDISVNRGALGAVTAGDVVVSVGAIGAARADRVSVQLGSIGAAAARELRVTTGAVGSVAAQSARFEQTLVRTVVAQRVTLGRGTLAGIVVAAHVDGEVRPLLDWRGGLAAGTIFALVWLMVRRLR